MSDERFGGWSIEESAFDWILSHLPEGSTLLEFGSGFVTDELAKHYKVYSIEHHPNYIDKRNTTYIYAPYNGGNWYNITILKEELPKITYDFILIDGPDSNKRNNFFKHSDMFNLSVPMLFDDMNEEWLRNPAETFINEIVKRPYELIKGYEKSSIGVA